MTATEYRQLFNEDGQPLCSRKTKSCKKCGHRYVAKGKPGSEYDLLDCPECGFPRGCRQVVKQPGDVCRHHSKDARKGIGHPNFTNGRHSKHIPAHLLPSYEQTMRDNQRLDLTAEIATLDALIDDRLEAISVGDHAAAWDELGKVVDRLGRALATKNPKATAAAFSELDELVSHSRDTARARAEATDLIMKRTRVTDSDRQRLSMLGEFMTRGAVLTLLRYIVEGVNENVKDLDGGPQALSRLSALFSGLLGQLRASWQTKPVDDSD